MWPAALVLLRGAPRAAWLMLWLLWAYFGFLDKKVPKCYLTLRARFLGT
jgi:hypothetical protein